uniref:Uncharacterized protein n=1 Tax=OCS116 cluster bacterium TaxID=2030921 RepID=A0A2A4YSJ0_9PROT
MIDYFVEHVHEVKKSEEYWSKMPALEGFNKVKKDYKTNVELKKFLNRKWHNAQAQDQFDVATIIIKDWGGIRGNKDETIRKYICAINGNNPETPIKGVASYSKLFSIVDLENYAIYDARVAVALNAIQYLGSSTDGLIFNYILGRNNTTGHSGKKVGFAYSDPFTKKALLAANWKSIKLNETYCTYIDLLKKCLRELPQHELPQYKLYDLEMCLFYNAEYLCKRAAEKANVSL